MKLWYGNITKGDIITTEVKKTTIQTKNVFKLIITVLSHHSSAKQKQPCLSLIHFSSFELCQKIVKLLVGSVYGMLNCICLLENGGKKNKEIK